MLNSNIYKGRWSINGLRTKIIIIIFFAHSALRHVDNPFLSNFALSDCVSSTQYHTSIYVVVKYKFSFILNIVFPTCLRHYMYSYPLRPRCTVPPSMQFRITGSKNVPTRPFSTSRNNQSYMGNLYNHTSLEMIDSALCKWILCGFC